MDYNTFAQTIKQKYPEYQNVDNLTLAQKIVAKYPEYSTKVTFEQPKPEQDFLQKAGNVVNKIFPGKQVGEAIGTAIATGVAGAKYGKEAALDVAATAPKPLQVVGDVAQGALTVGGLGASGLATSATSKAVGVGSNALSKVAIPTAKTVAGRIGQSALVGAGLGVTGATAQGKPLKEVAQEGAISGVIGGALGGVSEGVGLLRQQLSEVPERLIRSATGQTKRQLLAGQDVSKYVLENRKIGTASKIIQDSQKNIETLSDQISSNIKSVNETVRIGDIFDNLASSESAINAQYNADDIKEIIKTLAPETRNLIAKDVVSLADANKLRQIVDRTIGDRGFIASQQTLNKSLLKDFSNTARETVKTKAPEGTRALFDDLKNEIRLRDALNDKVLGQSKNQIISFGDLIGGGLGTAVGGPAGALGGVALKRVSTSTPFLTGAGVGINELNKRLGPIITKLQPAERAVLIQTINQLISQR